MKNRIPECKVEYESWQMQCCGEPLAVGKVANLTCIKHKRKANAAGIETEYDEEHHGQGANCLLSGVVSRLQTVFVDKFAPSAGKTNFADNPDNEFAVIDTDYIDGREQSDSYGKRNGRNAAFYIVTLKDVIEMEYMD